MNKINKSNHLFLCVGRSNNCNGDYPLQGIYELSFDGADWFQIKQVFDLHATDAVPKDSVIITESMRQSCTMKKRPLFLIKEPFQQAQHPSHRSA